MAGKSHSGVSPSKNDGRLTKASSSGPLASLAPFGKQPWNPTKAEKRGLRRTLAYRLADLAIFLQRKPAPDAKSIVAFVHGLLDQDYLYGKAFKAKAGEKAVRLICGEDWEKLIPEKVLERISQ